MLQRAAGKPAAYFVFVVLIMAEFLMAKLEFMVVAFFKARRRAVSDILFDACSSGLPERSTYNLTGGVCTEYTPVALYHEHNSLLTSTDHICACGSRLKHELQRHLCAHEKSLSSGQPCHLRAGLCLIFSLPVHHNTKHHLDSTTFSRTTLYTEHLIQNLYSRQAAQMNRSRTSITRLAETRATPLPQYDSSLFAIVLEKVFGPAGFYLHAWATAVFDQI